MNFNDYNQKTVFHREQSHFRIKSLLILQPIPASQIMSFPRLTTQQKAKK